MHTDASDNMEMTVENNESQDNVVQSESASYEVCYVIGIPLSHPTDDLRSENLSWFLDTFSSEISMGDPSANNIF